MLIVILNLVILIAIVYLLFYGLKQWKKLIIETDENEPDNFTTPVEESKYRLPIWILLIGIFIMTLVSFLYNH